MSLWGVFLTGLLAGAASCAAVQGGLLAGLLAKRKGVPAAKRKGSKRSVTPTKAPPTFHRDDVIPVGGFLAGKLVSHTILGGLLGLLGQSFQVSIRTQSLMLLLAGAVMLIMGLDLLGVRAVRGLIPTVPARWSALVRRRAGSTTTALAPAGLGFATVLIPCGITLSMELLAITSGSPIAGAAIMAVFVLGTSPLFAAFGYLIKRASKSFGNTVAKLAAVAVLVMAVVTFNSGLVLSGSSLNLMALGEKVRAAGTGGGPVNFASAATSGTSTIESGLQTISIDVGDYGYSPESIQATAGLPTKIVLKTAKARGCTRAFVVPDLRIQKVLPESGTTEIDLGILEKGALNFTCSMGMYGGEINFV